MSLHICFSESFLQSIMCTFKFSIPYLYCFFAFDISAKASSQSFPLMMKLNGKYFPFIIHMLVILGLISRTYLMQVSGHVYSGTPSFS